SPDLAAHVPMRLYRLRAGPSCRACALLGVRRGASSTRSCRPPGRISELAVVRAHGQNVDRRPIQAIAFQADLDIAAGQVTPATTRRLAGRADTREVAEGRRHGLPHILRVDPQQFKSPWQQLGRPIRVAAEPAQVFAADADVGRDTPELARRTGIQLVDAAPAIETVTPAPAQSRQQT